MARPLANAAARRAEEARFDSLVNLLTGIGDKNHDKRLQARWRADLITQQELESFYRASSMAAAAVEAPVLEEFRRGFDLRIGEDDGMDDTGREQAEETQNTLEERGFWDRIQDARIWSRAYGGAGLLLGAEDGLALTEELDLTSIVAFETLTVLSPEELRPVAWDQDVQSARYGEPVLYEIVPLVDNLSTSTSGRGLPRNVTRIAQTPVRDVIQVHHSRIVRMDGVRVSRRQLRSTEAAGWGDSVLVRCRDIIRDYAASWQAVALMVQNFSQARMKIKGLADILGDEDAGKKLLNRMTAVQASRSAANLVILDSEEDFDFTSPGLSGLREILQQMAVEIAAELRIPVTILMGQAPAGLNATGDSDVRNYYARVDAERKRYTIPAINRVLQVLFNSADGPTGGVEPSSWQVTGRPLWQPTDVEQAQIRFQQQQTDVGYIGQGVLSPEEVAVSRFGGAHYSTETFIDPATRKDITPDDSDKPPELPPAVAGAGLNARTFGQPRAQAQKADGKKKRNR